MIKKIFHGLSKQTLYYRSTFTFSQNDKGPQEKKSKRKPTLSQGLEKIIIQYLRILRKQSAKGLKGDETAKDNLNGAYDTIKDYLNSKGMGGGGTNKNQFDVPQQAGKLRNNIAFLFILGALFTLFNQGNPERSSVTNKAGRLVNESQMLALLSSGKFNPDILIIREVIQSGPRPIYQTICLAKQMGKTQIPTSCVITNLPSFLQTLQKISYPYRVNFNYSAEVLPAKAPINIGNIIMFSLLAYLVYKYKTGGLNLGQGGMSDMLNMKKFEPIKPQNIKTYFKDVAGMHQAKKQITQFVDFLKNPDKYIEMGAKIPKGALLTGPPGTGKTLLARACAGEAGVPFFYVSGSEFVEKYVGMGANRVRSLFDSAAKVAPSIIFIDEIDAIGKKRNSGPFANQQKENTLNQLLVNMDGFDTKHKIIVLAATNIKDSLDPALLRPGRFDRAVEINLPNFQQRIQILKVHLAKVKHSSKFTVDQFSKKISVLTPGFSGAQLSNICNEAAILAARENKENIEMPEFEKATERVMAGLEKRNLFSDQEKECLAYYECGKAVASWFTEGADPVIKISIVPYSKSNKGYSHEIKDQMPLKTEQQLLNKAMCYLAGRASEKMFKGYITSNGDSDMKKAKRIITLIVTKFGMSKLGKIGFPDIQYVRKPYSEATQKKIDEQIERIFNECQTITQSVVKEKSQYILKLKTLILQKETLTHHALKEILGERPFSNNQNYERFLKDSKQGEEVVGTPEAAPPL